MQESGVNNNAYERISVFGYNPKRKKNVQRKT